MSINLTVPDNNATPQLKPKITVIGVGGAGGNAVNNMIRAELEGVDFVAANTDAQALALSRTERRIQMGTHITEGLGAGSRPEVGRAAAEESIDEIVSALDGSHMAFIAAGMGGGTGTGGAPVIARAAKEHGILTVGVVTKPFQFEGSHRMAQAETGLEDLEQYVDTLIVIPNQNLFRIANEKTTFADAFAMADEVLYSGVRGVTDLMVMPGLINLDFADIRSVMSEMGKAMMGTGEAEGERRALDAAEAAIANPLLDDTSMKGAKGVLINITGGMDITLFEVDEAANRIRAEVDPDAYIIVGSAFDSSMDGVMRVSVVATGIDADAARSPMPTMLHLAEQLDDPVAEPVSWFESESEPEFDRDPEPEPEPEYEPEYDPEFEPESPGAAGELPMEAMAEPEIQPQSAPAAESEAESVQAPEYEPETRPAAMPSVGAVDAFIPPRPAEGAETDDAMDRMPETGADPAAVAEDAEPAAEADASPEPATPRRLPGVSLFERVTGTGRAAFGKKGNVTAEASEVTENKGLSITKEADSEPAAGPVAAAAPEAEAAEGAPEAPEADEAAPTIGGVDPDDRLPDSAQGDEDLLDIPAFLRRQAN